MIDKLESEIERKRRWNREAQRRRRERLKENGITERSYAANEKQHSFLARLCAVFAYGINKNETRELDVIIKKLENK